MLFDAFFTKNILIQFKNKIKEKFNSIQFKNINDAFLTTFDLLFQIAIVFIFYFCMSENIFNNEINLKITKETLNIIVFTIIGLFSRYISSKLIKTLINKEYIQEYKKNSNKESNQEYIKMNNHNTFFAFLILLLSNLLSKNVENIDFLHSIFIILISQILNIQTNKEYLKDLINFIFSNRIVLLFCLCSESFIFIISDYDNFHNIIFYICITIVSLGFVVYENINK